MATITLPSSCDLSEVVAMRDSILANRGADLDIDGGSVERINALALQVLASAEKTWRKDGFKLQLTSVSDRLADTLKLVNLELPEAQS